MTPGALDEKYRTILCDVWGVIHDGVTVFPGVVDRLRHWRSEGRTVILLTNAPRTVESVEVQLDRLGLPADCHDGIATSGEAGIAALQSLRTPVGFIGTAGDRAVLEGRHIALADGEDFTDLACTGIDEQRREIGEYLEQLEQLSADRVRMHCLNPDRLVLRGGVPEPCAGAIAEVYEQLGGPVTWYGKPYPAIYDHAVKLAGDPPLSEVLAIGDGLQTDVLGAARYGLDCMFITSGIHQGEALPSRFASDHDLGDWKPVAVVSALG